MPLDSLRSGGDKTQMTFSSNGKFKGNIEVTNTGDLLSVSKDNKGTSAQGQGLVKRQIIRSYKEERLLKKASKYYVVLRSGVQTLAAS